MANEKVRVGINGYGVIGKRVADAVTLQDDMALVGVADVVHDYRIRVAPERGYLVFAATAETREAMRTAGIDVAGTLNTLLPQVDVIVDCTPKKVAAVNHPLYEQAHVKAIYQGGEKHEVAGYSFVAQANQNLDPQPAALWKAKPLVAGRAGGIPMQFPAGYEHYLVDSVEDCAMRVLELLGSEPHRRGLDGQGRRRSAKTFCCPVWCGMNCA